MEVPRTRIVIGAYLRQQGLCPYCKLPVTKENATWEHIIPKAWGGANSGLNIILACQACNTAKSAIESLISSNFKEDVDITSKAALFILRCMKLNTRPHRKHKLAIDTYLRMAVNMQTVAEDWARNGKVALPELNSQTRSAFI